MCINNWSQLHECLFSYAQLAVGNFMQFTIILLQFTCLLSILIITYHITYLSKIIVWLTRIMSAKCFQSLKHSTTKVLIIALMGTVQEIIILFLWQHQHNNEQRCKLQQQYQEHQQYYRFHSHHCLHSSFHYWSLPKCFGLEGILLQTQKMDCNQSIYDQFSLCRLLIPLHFASQNSL